MRGARPPPQCRAVRAGPTPEAAAGLQEVCVAGRTGAEHGFLATAHARGLRLAEVGGGVLPLLHSPLLKYTRRNSGRVSRILSCSSASKRVTDMELGCGRKDNGYTGRGGDQRVLLSPGVLGPHAAGRW